MPRSRKPTGLHVLTGTSREDRHGDRGDEPKPKLGAKPPSWLPEKAREVWRRPAPRLLRLGLLTVVDGEALALLCAHLATAGEMMRAGQPVTRRLSAEIRHFFAAFGLTPGDRSKVTSSNPPEAPDPFAPWRRKPDAS